MGAGGAGFDTGAVARLFERAEAEVVEGRLPACQLAVARGDALETATFGAPAGARFVIFSLTKSLIAGAMWVLFGERSLSPSTRVAELIPEFGTHGKDVVTVEQLLTHTAGFPEVVELSLEEATTSAGRAARFAHWRLEWDPGSKTVYHPTSAHWVLAEVIERAAGVDFRSFVSERVTVPLGLPRLRLGVPESEQSDVVEIAVVGTVPPGSPEEEEAGAQYAEAGARLLLAFNDPVVRAVGVPGAGAVGSAADLAQYFQAMLHNPGRLWDPDVLADATSNVRNALPEPLTGIPSNRTLGLKVAGDDGHAPLREVGASVGPRTFVASGAGGQVAWADPDTGLSFCFLTSGIEVDLTQSFLRSSELSTLAGRCAAR